MSGVMLQLSVFRCGKYLTMTQDIFFEDKMLFDRSCQRHETLDGSMFRTFGF